MAQQGAGAGTSEALCATGMAVSCWSEEVVQSVLFGEIGAKMEEWG
jgi:hypothetical protein